MIITINGDMGSGKNTVGEILSKKLSMKLYCMGDMRRKMAEKRGMTLEQLNKLGETQSFTDYEVDKFQEELGKKEDNFIMIGRTSFYFISQSKKIYLAVDPKIGAKRIFNSPRTTEKYSSLEEAIKKIEERKQSDIMRYKKYYNLDNVYSHEYYDFVVDTSRLTPEEVAGKIIKFIRK
jgi:predicted cytidylate kinase